MSDLISLSRSENRSLGTLKPLEIIDFVIEESEHDWKPQWAYRLKQMKMFDPTTPGAMRKQLPIKKVPFTFKYRFITQGDARPRTLSIHDWEIGMLYWKCLRQTEGNEHEAAQLVKKRYFDEFVAKKDILLFLGTTYEFHKRRVGDPFIIVGVFYPPKTPQLSLFQSTQ